MTRDEMSPSQLEWRAGFADMLKRAGWDFAGWEKLFESGISLSPEAQAEYHNSTLGLRAGYQAQEGYLSLDLVDPKAEFAANLRLFPRDRPDDILATIVKAQDSLSPDTFADFVVAVIPLTKLALLDTPDGLVELSL